MNITVNNNNIFSFGDDVLNLLDVKVGDKIMFLNNVRSINALKRYKNINAFDYIQKQLKLKPSEVLDSINTVIWMIAKGEPLFYRNGEPIMQEEEQTDANKRKYLNSHKKLILDTYRNDLIEYFGKLSDEELFNKITLDMIEIPAKPYVAGGEIIKKENHYEVYHSPAWSEMKSSLHIETVSASYTVVEEPCKIGFNNGKYNSKEIKAYIMLLNK